MVKKRREGFGKASPGKIKAALCSESCPRKSAKTFVKGMGGARSQCSPGMRFLPVKVKVTEPCDWSRRENTYPPHCGRLNGLKNGPRRFFFFILRIPTALCLL